MKQNESNFNLYFFFFKSVASFKLEKICSCMQISKNPMSNEVINYDHLFSFDETKCFEINIMKKYDLHALFNRIHLLFDQKYNTLQPIGQEEIRHFLGSLNYKAKDAEFPDERKCFSDIRDLIEIYMQLSSNGILVLKEDETNFFNQ